MSVLRWMIDGAQYTPPTMGRRSIGGHVKALQAHRILRYRDAHEDRGNGLDVWLEEDGRGASYAQGERPGEKLHGSAACPLKR